MCQPAIDVHVAYCPGWFHWREQSPNGTVSGYSACTNGTTPQREREASVRANVALGVWLTFPKDE